MVKVMRKVMRKSRSNRNLKKKSLNRILKRNRFQKKSKKRSRYNKKSLRRRSLKRSLKKRNLQKGGWGDGNKTQKTGKVQTANIFQSAGGWGFRREPEDY